jgi:adenylate cyclase
MSTLKAKLQAAFRPLLKHKGALTVSFGVSILALLIYTFTFVGENPTPAFRFIHRTELAALDLRFQQRGTVKPDPRIVVVDIDQKSQEELGRWPFPRSHFAKMLDAVREDGARVVAFDITFGKPDETVQLARELRSAVENLKKRGQPVPPAVMEELRRRERESDYDQQFADAIQRFGKVVLGNFFLYSDADLKGVSDAALDRYASILAEFTYPQVRAAPSAKGRESYINLIRIYDDLDFVPRGAQANLELFSEALIEGGGTTGYFNVVPDADNVVRHAILALPYGRSGKPEDADLYASMDVQAVRLFLDLPEQKTVLNFGEAGIESLEFGPDLLVKPDNVGRALINFQGDVRTYKYYSVADVVQRKFEPGTFQDKIVLVGASATGIGDLRSTPFGPLNYPGVEIHANVIDNILNRSFLVRGAQQVQTDFLLITLLGMPLGICLVLVQPRLMVLALLLLLPLGGFLYAMFLKGWWLNAIVPTATLLANTGLVALYRVLVEEKEKRKVHGEFRKYLSPEVIRRQLESPEQVQPRKVEISVMFSDIRGFTSISEALDAQELAEFLNAYLTDMTRIVFKNRGTLDKYIGDAVMAFWGAPFEEPGHAEGACQAALDMMNRMAELQKEWAEQGRPKLEIGLGINTGIASVGNMGSVLRYGYTAMGDTVNLASRLEGLNKEYGTHIIVSETTFREVKNPALIFRELDLIRVKGKLQPVTIYELLWSSEGTDSLSELAQAFTKARALYRSRHWAKGQAAFEEILKRWPEDGPSRAYWKRCQDYLFDAPPPGWDGVYVMTHK